MTLRRIELEARWSEKCQNLGEVLEIGGKPGRKNDNVIQATESSGPLEALEQRVHHVLECGWSVTEAEWHYVELVEAIRCYEGGFFPVHFIHGSFPISRPEVEGGKILGPVKTVMGVIYPR